MIQSDEEIVDLLEKYPEVYDDDVVKAERRGKEKLVLYKLSAPFKRLDGEMAEYQLNSYTLTAAEDYAGVMHDDWEYWKADELDLSRRLFDQLRLFP